MIAPPEVQVGDWVQVWDYIVIVDRVNGDAFYSRGGTRYMRGEAKQVRGTRDGQPYHWTREGGETK